MLVPSEVRTVYEFKSYTLLVCTSPCCLTTLSSWLQRKGVSMSPKSANWQTWRKLQSTILAKILRQSTTFMLPICASEVAHLTKIWHCISSQRDFDCYNLFIHTVESFAKFIDTWVL